MDQFINYEGVCVSVLGELNNKKAVSFINEYLNGTKPLEDQIELLLSMSIDIFCSFSFSKAQDSV